MEVNPTLGTAVWQERCWEVSLAEWSRMQVEAALFLSKIGNPNPMNRTGRKSLNTDCSILCLQSRDLRQDTDIVAQRSVQKVWVNSKNPAFRTAWLLYRILKKSIQAVTALKSIETEFRTDRFKNSGVAVITLRTMGIRQKKLQNPLMHKTSKDPIVKLPHGWFVGNDKSILTNRSCLINCFKNKNYADGKKKKT